MNEFQSIGSAKKILREVEKAIVGKEEVIIKVLLSILAGGHILMEDIPGVGKTTMALAFSRALGLDYNRVQFTPDVLPSDVTGYSVYDKESGQMRYQKGAILCNLFLADELNRATSRTQSALLQAMEEGVVTVDGANYALPEPFIVIATQNPIGAKGTQMLPDSQMDRFMIRLSIGYPSHEDEIEMLRRRQNGVTLESVGQVVSREAIAQAKNEVRSVYVKEEMMDYIVSLCAVTRNDPRVVQGASPRASLSLTALSKATAWIQGRDYVLPRDVRYVFHSCVEHRLIWSADAPVSVRRTAMEDFFASVRPPVIK
ncbi:MAG: MoxR family ATPase [Oscillospiraceae bacterium]|nr:MoxR family ATPase [Oscillospiraceae bacterium]